MDADQRVRRDPRLDVVGARARLIGDELGQGLRVAAEDLALTRLERGAAGDDPRCRLGDLGALLRREAPVAPLEEPPEGREDGLPRLPRANGLEQLGLEDLHLVVEEVLLRGEVVEDRPFRHVGGAGDLGNRHLVEATLREQAPGRLGDPRPPLLLLSLSEAQLDTHLRSLAFILAVTIFLVLH